MTQGSPLAVPMPWDLVSSAYAEEVVPMFEAFAREALRLVAPPASSRIVDVACGPGTLSVLAAQDGHRVDALDFSPQMIDKLTARIAQLGISTITPQLGDGQALPYADATFDAGFSMFGLMFFPDRAKGFAELRRVLEPGAKALVSSWHPMDKIPVFTAMFGAIRETMSKVTGAPPPPDRPMPLTTVDECRTEMSASFADVAVHEFATTQEAPSTDALWESLTRTMAPIVLMKKNLGDKFAAIDAAAREAMRAAIGSGPARLEMKAHFTVGTAR
ncbi:MAG TPA: class I SAM-dependent methyltransferase [Kofleriaceae bacterium]